MHIKIFILDPTNTALNHTTVAKAYKSIMKGIQVTLHCNFNNEHELLLLYASAYADKHQLYVNCALVMNAMPTAILSIFVFTLLTAVSAELLGLLHSMLL
jgi:hypothetical protein